MKPTTRETHPSSAASACLSPAVSSRADCRAWGCPATPWHWACRWVLQRAALTGAETVCDLGAGDNPILLAAFNEHAAMAYLVDNLLLPDARRLASHVVRVQADISRRLPFEDDSIDVAMSVSVFEHLTAAGRKTAIAEVQRVLKPGGRLVFTLGNLLRADAQAAHLLRTLPFFIDRHCGVHLPLDIPDMLSAAPYLVLMDDRQTFARCCPGVVGYDEETLVRDEDICTEAYESIEALAAHPSLRRIVVCEVGLVLVKQCARAPGGRAA